MKKIIAVLSVLAVIAIIGLNYMSRQSALPTTQQTQNVVASEDGQLTSVQSEPAHVAQAQVTSGEVTVTTSMSPNFSDNPKIGSLMTNSVVTK